MVRSPPRHHPTQAREPAWNRTLTGCGSALLLRSDRSSTLSSTQVILHWRESSLDPPALDGHGRGRGRRPRCHSDAAPAVNCAEWMEQSRRSAVEAMEISITENRARSMRWVVTPVSASPRTRSRSTIPRPTAGAWGRHCQPDAPHNGRNCGWQGLHHGWRGWKSIGGQSIFLEMNHVLNEEAGVWEQRADMPTRRSGGGAAVIDSKIYVAGGRPPRGADFAVYDPAADTWTTLPDMPTARNHLAVSAVGGKVVVAGGRFGGGVGSEMTDIVEIYDPAMGRGPAVRLCSSPARGWLASSHGCMYAIGGEGNDADPRGIFEENEMFNPMTNAWERLEPMPLPTHGLTGAAAINGSVYIPGWRDQRGVSGPDVHQAAGLTSARLSASNKELRIISRIHNVGASLAGARRGVLVSDGSGRLRGGRP